MTCIEKLKELRPDWTEEDIECYTSAMCPAGMYIAPDAAFCTKTFNCKKCWERDIPALEEDNLYEFRGKLNGETMRRLINLRDRLDKDPEDVIQAALLLYEDALNALDVGNKRWAEMSFHW